jgi:hypothetical protein
MQIGGEDIKNLLVNVVLEKKEGEIFKKTPFSCPFYLRMG